VTFRLHLRLHTGDFVTITEGSTLDQSGEDDGIIVFSQALGAGHIQGTVAVSEPDGGVFSILTLSTSATYAGPGSVQMILEDVYSTSRQQGTFQGTIGGLLLDDLVTLDPAGALLHRANATFNTYANLTGAVPDLGIDGFGSGPAPALVGGEAAFGATGVSYAAGSIPTAGISNANTLNLNFTAAPYSIYSVATINFTGSAITNQVGTAEFTLRGEVRTFGDPLVSGTPTSVPEPTTLLLLGSGLVALGLLRRKNAPTA
jgi:hypothetical protein